MIQFSENIVLALGFMLVLVAIKKSSRGEKVVGVSTVVFQLCDVWTGDAGPSSTPRLGARHAWPSKLTVLIDRV